MLIHLAAFVVVVAGIMAAKSILMPFLLASFLAIICAPPLYWLRSKGFPPPISPCFLVQTVRRRLLAGNKTSNCSGHVIYYQTNPITEERV